MKAIDAIKLANADLRGTPREARLARLTVISILETKLREAGVQFGYAPLPTEFTEDGTALREGYDKTRRFYFLHSDKI